MPEAFAAASDFLSLLVLSSPAVQELSAAAPEGRTTEASNSFKGKLAMMAKPQSPLSQHCSPAPVSTVPSWSPGREFSEMDSEAESYISPKVAPSLHLALPVCRPEPRHPTHGLATRTVGDVSRVAFLEPLGSSSNAGFTLQNVVLRGVGVQRAPPSHLEQDPGSDTETSAEYQDPAP